MTTLREAAQQALEALGLWATGCDVDAVALNDLIFRLEAALAEHEKLPMVEIETVLTVQAEPTVPSDCADSHQPGCDRCRSPLWCGDKCSVCGAVYANK